MAMEGSVGPEKSGVKFWRYSLPNVKGQGWAICFLDEAGCFAALSDYGNVSYRWNMRGVEADFRAFIASCDDPYLRSKLGQGRLEYDPEATFSAVKNTILEDRGSGCLSKELAREEYDRLDVYNNLRDEHEFAQWFEATDLGDAAEYRRARYVSEVTHFVSNVMPRLRELLRLELAAPAEVRP